MFTENDNQQITFTVTDLAHGIENAMNLDGFAMVRRTLSDDFDLKALVATVLNVVLREQTK